MTTGKTALEARDWKAVASLIDHTVLKPEATPGLIEQLCREAAQYGFAAVCVQPCYVALAAALLENTPVKVASVVGFPHGATLSAVKRYEALAAIRLGAREIDMVQNVGAIKAGDRERALADISAVADAAHENGAILKVILENALLTREEKIVSCELALTAGADFVKTSTGFAADGATAEDVTLMRSLVGEHVGVKAAGGIRTASDLLTMLSAGANRIGASASVAIVKELGAPGL